MNNKSKLSILFGSFFIIMLVVAVTYNTQLESISAAIESGQKFSTAERYRSEPDEQIVEPLTVNFNSKVIQNSGIIVVSVSGGIPPYKYTMNWRDGSTIERSYSQEYRELLTHQYKEIPEYVFITVQDSSNFTVQKRLSIIKP